MDAPIYVVILAGLVFASLASMVFVLWDEERRPTHGTRTVTRRWP